MNGGYFCLKVFFVIFTFLNSLVALAKIVVGWFILKALPDRKELFGGSEYELINEIRTVIGVILLCTGAALFVASLIGCSGAVTKNSYLLTTFVLLLLVLISCYLYAVYQVNLYLCFLEGRLKEQLIMAMSTQDSYLDMLQSLLKCCGTTGPLSYIAIKKPIPQSCCPLKQSSSITCTKGNSYYIGCHEHIKNLSGDKSYLLLYVLIGLIGFKILQVIMGILLAVKSRSPTSNVRFVQQNYPVPVEEAPPQGPPAYASAPPLYPDLDRMYSD